MISVHDRVENIVGKGENAGYQYFLLFPQCFQPGIVWERVKIICPSSKFNHGHLAGYSDCSADASIP